MAAGSFKERVAEHFAGSIATYDSHAEEQRLGAAVLAGWLAERRDDLVAGPVLEIGCGTGLLSSELAALVSGRGLTLSDLAPAMVGHCRRKIDLIGRAHPNIQYEVLDGEQLTRQGVYALVCANFAVHWFVDMEAGLIRLLQALKPGGYLLCSYPGPGSYRQWHQHCARLGVPCTANLLPNPASVAGFFATHPVKICQWEREIELYFSTAHDFLRHFKCTGADIPTRPEAAPLGSAQLRKLIRGWDQACPDGVEVNCAINFLAVEKEGESCGS